MYAAIDVAAAKISRQLRKFKTRVQDKRKRKAEKAVGIEHAEARAETELDLDRLMDELADDEIVRRKKIVYKPLTEEEALIEIDLVGHDFFVYTDRDTNEVNVIYRRKDGSYGILSPEDEEE